MSHEIGCRPCRRLAIAALALALGMTIAPAGAQDLAIVDVTVIPMDTERVLPAQTVIIRGGRILSIAAASAGPPPEDLPVLDGRGRFLTPGLADLHTHIRDGGELVNYLAWGVTTIMHLGGSGLGGEALKEFRREIGVGDRLGPNLYLTDRVFDGSPALPSNARSLTDPAEARRAVRAVREGGYDFVKIYNNVSAPVFDAIVAEADLQGLSVIGHIPRSFDPRESLGGGQDAVANTEEFFFTWFRGPRSTDGMPKDYRADRQLIPELVRLLVQHDVAVMPDLSFEFTNMLMWDDLELVWQDPELAFVHPRTVSMWQGGNINRRDNLDNFVLRGRIKYDLMHDLTYAFQQAGVLQVIGTDASLPGLFPGKAAHRELTELIKAGLTHYEAFSVGTRNAGEFLRRYIDEGIRTGQVQPGFDADLLLLDANPLDDVRNARRIHAVIVRGRLAGREAIGTARESLAARYAYLSSLNEQADAAITSEALVGALRELALKVAGDDEAAATLEARINAAGYAAAFAGNLDEAERLLDANAQVFPGSANTWDSLAEVVAYRGDRERAIRLYRKALEVDPGFAHAAEQLRELLNEPVDP